MRSLRPDGAIWFLTDASTGRSIGRITLRSAVTIDAGDYATTARVPIPGG